MEIFAVLRKTNRLVIRPVPIAGTTRGYVNLAYLTGRDDLRVVRPAPQPQPNVTPNTTVAGVVLSDEALAKLDDPVHSASPPAYTFTPRVLDRWGRQNLHYTPDEETGGGQAQFRFHMTLKTHSKEL